MNKITRYRVNIDDAMKKVKNNIDYFDSYGDVYVTQKFCEYLNNIYDEMEKLRLLVLSEEDDLVVLEPNSDNT